MKERQILMNGEMVRAILAGRKTQTRRLVAERHMPLVMGAALATLLEACPFGQPGDRLWVREAFCDATAGVEGRILYRADGDDAIQWRPSIHMPRWASRINLEITGVRVERLKNISPDDCISEGAWSIEDRELGRGHEAVEAFRSLWESINGDGSWAENPWVWVVEFRRVEA